MNVNFLTLCLCHPVSLSICVSDGGEHSNEGSTGKHEEHQRQAHVLARWTSIRRQGGLGGGQLYQVHLSSKRPIWRGQGTTVQHFNQLYFNLISLDFTVFFLFSICWCATNQLQLQLLVSFLLFFYKLYLLVFYIQLHAINLTLRFLFLSLLYLAQI